jgi:ElaB/YqjD/DUF883 family membrane-anchored ribosome-binding protein
MARDVTTQKLKDDLKTVIRDGTELLQQTAGDLTEKGREAREKLGAALESAQATLKRVEEKAIEGARATDRVIREHPYQTAGIAFGVGLLIGLLLHRGK